MLDLVCPSRASWVAEAVADVGEILVDHAHCEKKAAGAAIKLLFSYPHLPYLQAPLSRLAREELRHFEEVLQILDRRGMALVRQRPSAYGGRLHEAVRKEEPQRLLDLLLVSSLIEARSCERFELLADHIGDPDLERFYRGLLACEARHHGTYVDLARQLCSDAEVTKRLAELAELEARALQHPSPVARLHS